MCVCASQQAAGACGLVVCDSWLGAYDVRDEGSAPNGWAPLLYRGVVRGRREPYHQTERHEGLVFSVYRDNVLCSGERESLVNTISDYGVTMGFGLRNCTVLGAKLRHAKPECLFQRQQRFWPTQPYSTNCVSPGSAFVRSSDSVLHATAFSELQFLLSLSRF